MCDVHDLMQVNMSMLMTNCLVPRISCKCRLVYRFTVQYFQAYYIKVTLHVYGKQIRFGSACVW